MSVARSNLSRPSSDVPNQRCAAAVEQGALDRIPDQAVGILRVVGVTNTPFRPGVELVHAGIRSRPQVALVVLHQVPNEVVAETSRVIRAVLVDDERIAVIPIEAVSGPEPDEPPAILQDVDDVVLRQAVVGREMCEPEIPFPPGVGGWNVAGAGGRGRSAVLDKGGGGGRVGDAVLPCPDTTTAGRGAASANQGCTRLSSAICPAPRRRRARWRRMAIMRRSSSSVRVAV